MATVDRRKTKSGAVTWRVRWHEGGRRTDPLDSETCDHEKDALDFAAMVRLAGERRPEGYPRGCRGRKLVPAEEPAQEPSKPTFAEVVEEYLATLVDAEPRTLAEYRRDLREHVRPAAVLLPGGSAVGPLGDLPIDECADPDIWQAWVAYMRAKMYGKKTRKHYAAKTIINIHGTLISPVFDFAIIRKYCAINPCRLVRLPERKGRPIKAHHVLDVEEFQAWIDCAYEVDEDTGDITALILGTGIRWGERQAEAQETRPDQGRAADDRASG